MAAGTLPKPGLRVRRGGRWVEIGPCVGPCEHKDCAQTRAMAESRCRLCGVKIGYEVRFYRDPDADSPAVIVHADCLEDAAL